MINLQSLSTGLRFHGPGSSLPGHHFGKKYRFLGRVSMLQILLPMHGISCTGNPQSGPDTRENEADNFRTDIVPIVGPCKMLATTTQYLAGVLELDQQPRPESMWSTNFSGPRYELAAQIKRCRDEDDAEYGETVRRNDRINAAPSSESRSRAVLAA